MSNVDILIVGAGPTGLGAAWRLSALGHAGWRLCERGTHAGGLAGSIVDEHGFTWDFGGHVQFSHYQYFDDLMDELLGPEGWLYHERESWIWLRDRFVPYPFQLNLHRLSEPDQAACVRGLISAAIANILPCPPPSPPCLPRPHAGERPFSEWIDTTFGSGIGNLFLRPYNWKVWAYPLETLSSQWVGDRVATVDLARVVKNIAAAKDDVSWGPNNQFRFPRRGGTGAIWRALAEQLQRKHPSRFSYGTTISRIDVRARRAWTLEGETIDYRAMLSTIPLDELVRIAGLSSELSAAAANLKYSSTHVIGVGLHGSPPPALAGKCWMYFPESNSPFYRVTVFSHYSPHNVPDIRRFWSLMAEVSESPVKPVDVAKLSREVIDGMVVTGLIPSRDSVHHVWQRRLEHGYPTPSHHRDRALADIQPVLASHRIFSRGRFGAWKYEVSNQDHSFAQGVECVDCLLGIGDEDTLNRPEHVNRRRSTPRRLVAPQLTH
ncbi:MAG TPA: FAD-dependent oxidoreductase [Vicinamibacterales bacterium]|nr:FAD-dependent oxidoreductase [Vicinamibacterales bacterium]